MSFTSRDTMALNLPTTIDYKNLLLENVRDLLMPESNYDVTIFAGKDQAQQTFRAHKFILSFRSPYCRRLLLVEESEGIVEYTGVEREIETEEMAEYTSDPCTFKFKDISPPVFDVVLQYDFSFIYFLQLMFKTCYNWSILILFQIPGTCTPEYFR